MKDKLGNEIRIGDTIVKATTTGSKANISVGVVSRVTESSCSFYNVTTWSKGLLRDKMGSTQICRSSSLIISLGYCLDYDTKTNELIGDVWVK